MRVSHVFFLYLAICIIVCIVCIRLHSRACAQEPSRGKRVVGCRRSRGLSCPPAPPRLSIHLSFSKPPLLYVLHSCLRLSALLCSALRYSALLCSALPDPPVPPVKRACPVFHFALRHIGGQNIYLALPINTALRFPPVIFIMAHGMDGGGDAFKQPPPSSPRRNNTATHEEGESDATLNSSPHFLQNVHRYIHTITRQKLYARDTA